MWEVEVYTFEDADGVEQTFTTQDAEEAKEYAREHGYRAVRNVYEFADSETLCDFTGQPQEVEA